jgi:hypothetical protein
MNREDKLILNAMPPLMRECIQCKKTSNVVKVRGISFSFTGIKVGGSIPPSPPGVGAYGSALIPLVILAEAGLTSNSLPSYDLNY